jgi:hypothetical protein
VDFEKPALVLTARGGASQNDGELEARNVSRILLSLSLIAALSGPLLRQAEGADDLIRSLSELGCPPLLEEADGGVGDDSGATILSKVPGSDAGVMDSPDLLPAVAVELPARFPSPPDADALSLDSRQGPPRSEGTPARLARLQRFLF